ncbi:MAG: 2-oxo acid dehydrogenase subunit E2 [Planctomycetaceae bacterium]
MAMQFKLPEVSEGVKSVDIAEILVAVGDTISSGTIVCEVETDKAVAEITCPHAGKITRLLVSSGDSVAIGQPLLELEPADSGDTRAAAAPTAPATQAAPASSVQASSPSSAQHAPAAASSAAPRTVQFLLPEVSEGVKKVDVAEVLISAGQTIEAGAAVCEVETDKAVTEINCPYAGQITAVHISSGTSIGVGDPVLTIETTSPAASGAPAAGVAPSVSASAGSPSAGASPARTVATPPTTPVSSNGSIPVAAGPATRRLARKLGVDLSQVQGSAKGGRVTIEDVENHVHRRMTQPAAASGGGMSLGVIAAAPLPDFSKFGPIEKEPLNKIFRTAASNLSTAWITIPHVTQHNLADITELEAARKRYVKDNPRSPKITMTAIMVKAVVGALRAFPKVNSSIDMESGELILKKYYNIGVAVDTPNGLVVPVIKNCDQKNVLQVASELTELALKARERKLKTEDMQGASFTITNLGGIGGTYFTPIVNPPEVAILGMSAGQQTLVMEDEKIAERLMLPLSMSYDHRAINGADAARFIVKLSGSLTNFFELF